MAVVLIWLSNEVISCYVCLEFVLPASFIEGDGFLFAKQNGPMLLDDVEILLHYLFFFFEKFSFHFFCVRNSELFLIVTSIRFGKQYGCDWLLGLTQARLGASLGLLKPGYGSAHPLYLYGCYVKLEKMYVSQARI